MAEPDATARFFEELARRGRDPWLGQMTTTVRFEVVEVMSSADAVAAVAARG